MTEEVSSKLSLLTRKLAEVGQLKGEIADKLFEEADAGIITKEQALEVLDTYDLLPTDGYVSLPPYLDSYEYFERYSKIRYMDFTCPDTGEIIDYFGGLEDIKEKLLRTPLPPIVTFDDDPLRILRGIRFSITKRLRVSEDMWQAMKAYDYFDKMPVVSEERIREELTKCFKCNSSLTLGWLSELTDLRDYIFKNTNLWLKPTNEK
jgi:hypothetical protein